MATPWCRLWADMPNDPKWRTIAKSSHRSIAEVMAVYVHLMSNATNANERGRTQGWSDEDIASALDMETADIEAIRNAMQGRVMEGEHLSGWEKRQPAREDGAAERAKQWRDKKKEENERKRTQTNAEERPDTDTDTDKIEAIDIPFHEIIAAYNKFCPSLPKVNSLSISPLRHSLIKAAMLKYRNHEGGALVVIDTLFKKTEASDFLTRRKAGYDGKFFTAKFDWIFDEEKMVKILEGDYDNPPVDPPRKIEVAF